MDTVNEFLNQEEEKLVVEAIKEAEKKTSGELRVHLQQTCNKEVLTAAKEKFISLKMNKTALRNGVLIYVAVKDRKFAIVGDKGINELVGEGFWNDVKELMLCHFKEGKNAQGLIEATLLIGQKLKQYFPFQSNDMNELSNEISKSE